MEDTGSFIYQEKPDLQTVLFNKILTFSGMKQKVEKEILSGRSRSQPAKPSGTLRESHEIRTLETGSGWILSPRNGSKKTLILYLHGGAFFHNINHFHWQLIGTLALKTDSIWAVADYPLLPETDCLKVYQFMNRFYQEILSEYSPEQVIFMGDSAGGGLALGFAQSLYQEKGLTPGRTILLSPWLDLSASHPETLRLDPLDPILSVRGLQAAGKAWRAGLDPLDYRVSPLYSDLKGTGEIAVFTGTCDLLFSDSFRLKEKADRLGLTTRYYQYEGMFHTWMLFNSLRESRLAVSQIGSLIDL